MRARAVAGTTGLALLLWALTVRGSLTLDLGIGRRFRPLGPLRYEIAAPREVVFDVVAAPYLGRTPRGSARSSRCSSAVKTSCSPRTTHPRTGLRATTVETVRFERPERVHFRLVRGPVPHVVERFELREIAGGTELEYVGELGTDLWALGALWGAAVARSWEATVGTRCER